MLAVLAIAVLSAAAACGPRRVEVQTGAQPQSATTLTVTNNSNDQVNVYVESGGTEILVGTVDANSTRTLSVQGVATGSVVTLRARPIGGSTSYSRSNVTLSGNVTWRVP
jgi:hypothetical protein